MMIKSMIQLQWNRIAVIYDDDTYGVSMKDDFIDRAKLVDICIPFSKSINIENGYSPERIKSLINEIIQGTANRPYINGILYIGFSRAANTMFHHLSNTQYSTVPIVMMTEAVGLDSNTYMDYTDRVYSKAKGTLISSPPQIKITEFSDHWNKVFQSQVSYLKESNTNPWLNEVYQAKCTTFPCSVGQMDQSVFVYYAVTAAHALTKCTRELNDLLKTDFKQKYILDHLKGLAISFNTDFSWRPGSIAHYRTFFDSNGEILKQSGNQTSWELYNLRPSTAVTNNVVFTKIGDLRGETVDIKFNEIRDYDGNDEVSWPDVRKAQCTIPRQCLECYSSEQLQEDIIFEAGDLYVVGIVPVYDNKGVEDCGEMRIEDSYQLVESIRLPIIKVNAKTGDYKNFFPGVKVGLIILNSCLSTAVTQRKIYNLHKNGVQLKNGTVIDLHGKILGFIGEYFSTTSMAIADVLTILKYVQISYASTSPTLKDRTKYPYFTRVVTPDDAQAKAMVEIMKKLDVTYAQIIYSSGAYGEDGKNKVKELSKQNDICIINEIEIADDSNPSALFEKLRLHSHARLVIAFLYPHDVKSHFEALTNQMEKGEFIFIGSEAWARNAAVLQADTNHVLLGSLTVSLEIYQDKELRHHIQNIKPLPYRENPWAQMYVQTKFDCYFNHSFDKSKSKHCDDEDISSTSVLDTYDTPAYICAQSLLIGANNFLKQACGSGVKSICSYYTPDGLVNEMLKVKLDLEGRGIPMKVFDSNGDGNVGYRVYNIQRDPENPQSLIYVEVGRFPLEGTFTFEKSMIMHPTKDGLMSKCPSEQTCASCFREDHKLPVIVEECP
ncbi:Metabotropic glutamate receptor 3 [Mactra antiquata]